MLRKVLWVGAIVACVIVTYLIMTACMPVITELTGTAANATGMEHYPGAKEAVQSAPIWLYAIPAIVGGVSIFIVLRQSEYDGY